MLAAVVRASDNGHTRIILFVRSPRSRPILDVIESSDKVRVPTESVPKRFQDFPIEKNRGSSIWRKDFRAITLSVSEQENSRA